MQMPNIPNVRNRPIEICRYFETGETLKMAASETAFMHSTQMNNKW